MVLRHPPARDAARGRSVDIASVPPTGTKRSSRTPMPSICTAPNREVSGLRHGSSRLRRCRTRRQEIVSAFRAICRRHNRFELSTGEPEPRYQPSLFGRICRHSYKMVVTFVLACADPYTFHKMKAPPGSHCTYRATDRYGLRNKWSHPDGPLGEVSRTHMT